MVRESDKEEAEKKKPEAFVPMKFDRSCTDIICCIIFLAFIVSMVAITGYSISTGDPLAMVTPFDSNGNQCGKPKQGLNNKVDFTNYKYKYMYQLLKIAEDPKAPTTWWKSVCVSECPKLEATSKCIKNNGLTTDCPKAGGLTNEMGQYGTHKVQTYCLPDKAAVKKVYGVLMNALSSNGQFVQAMNDVQQCWQAIVGMCAATIVIALIYVLLLKWIVKPILYVSMVLILGLFVLFGVWCMQKRNEYDPVTAKKNYDYATIGMGVGFGLAGLYACFMLCCWKNISLGASIMEAASDFVGSNLRIITLPIFAYIIALIFFAYWIVTAIYLYGVGDAVYDPKLPIAKVNNNKQTTYIMWYFLFGLLWIVAFFICLQQFIIGAMVCMWYFCGQGKEQSDVDGQGVSILKAVHWGTWYHCGSVSFGAFCIAVITMIRIVFEYIVYQTEKIGQNNPIYKAVVCCTRCVLYCLDKYVKFITKNAFIQIALHNDSFCPAAWASFFLIVRNAGRFGSATIIGYIMMMLGKGTIVGLSAFLTVVIIQQGYKDVQQPFLPAGFVAIVAYVVGSFFLSIFSFSCTAILHCFIMADDSNANVASPPSLEPFLKHNDEQNAAKGSSSSPAKKTDDDAGDKKADAGDEAKGNDVS